MDDKSENNLSDRLLVERVLSGDTNAFSIIISKTERLVAQIVFKLISNTEDRRDIAQDIYLKAFAKLATFRYQAKLSTWIAQIAYNTCLNYLEKKKLVFVNNSDYVEDDEQIAFSKTAGEYHDTESVFLNAELGKILKTEIANLSPLFKTLITLYHTEELSYEEIAQITSLPEGTLKSYLFRARKALRDNLLKKYKKAEL